MFENLFKQIDLFLSSFQRNKWVDDDIKIYLRKSHRKVKEFDNVVLFIDLASIEIFDEKNHNKGIFSSFLKEFIDRYKDKNIFVESIVNPALIHILEKFGFKLVENTNVYQIDMYYLSNNQK